MINLPKVVMALFGISPVLDIAEKVNNCRCWRAVLWNLGKCVRECGTGGYYFCGKNAICL